MKRDMDLVREILLQIEANDDVAKPSPEQIYTIGGHLILLMEAGLVAGVKIEEDMDSGFMWYYNPVPRLTWEGHEFLDAARNDGVWHDAKQSIASKVGSASMSVLKAVLAEITLQKLGLKP